MSSVHYENVKNKLYAQYSDEISQLIESYKNANCDQQGDVNDDHSKENFTVSYPAQRLMCLRAANKFTEYYKSIKEHDKEHNWENNIVSDNTTSNSSNNNNREENLTDNDIAALLANINIKLGDDVSSKELSMQFLKNSMRKLQDESVRRLQSVTNTNCENSDDVSCVHDASAQRMLILHKLEEQLAKEKVVCKASRIDVK